MRSSWRSVLVLAALASVVGGCDPVAPGPEPLTAPASPSATLNDGTYTLVTAPLTTPLPRVSDWIGASGGTLRLAGHTLTVPPGAVQGPTLFSMLPLASGHVEVELLAAAIRPLLGLVDVGSDGFDEPVELTLSYAAATNVDDPDRLVILHLRDDGGVEEVPSTVHTATKTVTAELEHFSRYAMAID